MAFVPASIRNGFFGTARWYPANVATSSLCPDGCSTVTGNTVYRNQVMGLCASPPVPLPPIPISPPSRAGKDDFTRGQGHSAGAKNEHSCGNEHLQCHRRRTCPGRRG